MNSKETLKKLHKRFPQLSLDELFDILDCYVEQDCHNGFRRDVNDVNLLKQITFYDGPNVYPDGSSDLQLTASHTVCEKQ